MTLEQIKAMPEADRLKFFRMIIAICEAGQSAGVSPEDWARLYVDIVKTIKENT